jgi:hypothetical protein
LGNSSRAWLIALLGCLVGYVGFTVWNGRFLGMDEVFFKAAGREWARSGRLAAPELTGVNFLQGVTPPIEEVWFVHPPLYPFLFGLFIKLVGFGPWQCVLYDSVIHALLALLTFCTAKQLREGLPNGWCFGIAMAVLPIGFFCRPDELAMCFGMLAVLAVLRTPLYYRHVVFSGITIGLCAATSVGAALLLGLIVVTLLVASPRSGGQTSRYGLVWGITALITLGLAIAPILIAHPGAYQQYLAHAADHVGRGNFLARFFTNWENEQFHRSITLACLSLAVVGLVSRSKDFPWGRQLRLWLGPIPGIGVLAAFLPDKVYYLWFLGPWMMVAGGTVWYRIGPTTRPLAWKGVTFWVLGLYAVAIAPFCKNLFIMLTIPEAQSVQTNTRIIRDLIPLESKVLTDDYWWVLGNDCRVYDRYFSRPDPESIDFIILMGNGSGDPTMAGTIPEYLADYVKEHFQEIYNNINTEPIRFLGKPIPNTAFGFGTMVLQRKNSAHFFSKASILVDQ